MAYSKHPRIMVDNLAVDGLQSHRTAFNLGKRSSLSDDTSSTGMQPSD